MRDYLINKLRSAKALRLDASRPQSVEKVHSTAHLTARERTALLLDPGSEVEFGAIAARDADGDWVPEKGGVDFIGTIEGETVITSSTDYTDRGGGYGAARLEHLISLAHQQRWPIAFFVDGGGSRARHPRAGLGHLELSGQIGRFTLFDGMAELSGWVPTVAIVSGPSFAGHASLAGFSDIVITTRGSAIGMGGPPMVEAALGLTLTPQELAGVEMHEKTGGIDLLVDDEPTAIGLAKRYLSYLWDHPSGEPHPSAEKVADLIPESGPYDIYPVISALVDKDSVFELRPQFAASVVTAVARIDGRTVGVVANNPNIDFVFAQLHHPHKSELWTPGNTDYTGEVVNLLENFSSNSGKPSIHFFGHTHGYSRGQSKNHSHLMVNVASAGGNLDSWGEYPNNDYDEYTD